MKTDTRLCRTCEASMAGKRPHAVYCSRPCKGKASKARLSGSVIPAGEYTGLVYGSSDHNQARYEREKDRRKAYARAYHKTHPEESKVIRARRRARKRNAVHYTFTDRDWKRLVHRYRGCCAYCGQKSEELQREHVIPLIKGGSHGVGNILPVCPDCNYRKHTSLLAVFRYRRGGGHALPRKHPSQA